MYRQSHLGFNINNSMDLTSAAPYKKLHNKLTTLLRLVQVHKSYMPLLQVLGAIMPNKILLTNTASTLFWYVMALHLLQLLLLRLPMLLWKRDASLLNYSHHHLRRNDV